MSTAFEKELILFLSMQKLYLKISRRRKGRWGIYVGSILIFTNKAIISEGQDNDHLFGEKKEKESTTQYCSFKHRICFVSQSAGVMRKKKKKYFALS